MTQQNNILSFYMARLFIEATTRALGHFCAAYLQLPTASDQIQRQGDVSSSAGATAFKSICGLY